MASKILLTGRPGIGKTTVIQKVVAAGIPLAGGFLTEEIREPAGRVGFRVKDIHSGKEGVLAHVRRKRAPKVGKYGVDVAFDRIGVGALHEAVRRQGCVIIDEIGKMELCSKAFRAAVTAVMGSGQPVLATVPVHRHPFLDALREREDVTVIEVTRSSRDDLPPRVVELLGLAGRGRP
jgi:nucleoside-triphosphatase